MPRRKATQIAQSQPLSQNVTIPEENASENNLDELVNKCVRYIIYRSHTNIPIKKNELKKNVLPNTSRNFDTIMEKASEVLEKVYGFKLVACDEPNSNTSYITVQTTDDQNTMYDPNEEIPSDINKVLIMLVLTNIFMSENPVNEAAMLIFLSTAGVNVDNDRGIFGNVKEFINNTMVKQNYIVLITDPLSREITYKWGPRSENTISKHKILQFVSKMYGDMNPASWVVQHREANDQFHNTDVENQDQVVDAN